MLGYASPKKLFREPLRIEMVNSVIKRRWGGGTTAKTRWEQRREALLKSVVYSIDKFTHHASAPWFATEHANL